MAKGMKKNLPTVTTYVSFAIDNPHYDGFISYEDALAAAASSEPAVESGRRGHLDHHVHERHDRQAQRGHEEPPLPVCPVLHHDLRPRLRLRRHDAPRHALLPHQLPQLLLRQHVGRGYRHGLQHGELRLGGPPQDLLRPQDHLHVFSPHPLHHDALPPRRGEEEVRPLVHQEAPHLLRPCPEGYEARHPHHVPQLEAR